MAGLVVCQDMRILSTSTSLDLPAEREEDAVVDSYEPLTRANLAALRSL